MTSNRSISLKVKSISWIAGLVLVLSALIFLTFSLLKTSIRQLSGMIDVTVSANSLMTMGGSVTEGLPFDIEAYALHPSEEVKNRIDETFQKIQAEIDSLEPRIRDDESRTQLLLVKNMFLSSFESFQEIVQKVSQGVPFSQVNDLIADIKDNSGLISGAVQQLISMELRSQQASKAKLERSVTLHGYRILIAMILSSFAGMVLFYLFVMKMGILSPLHDMQDTIEKIGSDASDMTLRVQAKKRDEIGMLAEYFNKMADTIQKYKEHLEELVDSRTRELRDAQAMLVQSGKLSALGEMAGGVAHEINNPLAIIQVKSAQLTEMLGDEQINRQAVVEMASEIERTADRIAKIIKGLRSFSRDARNDPYQTLPLKTILEDVFSLCSEKCRLNSVDLREPAVPESLVLECRPTELSQVLLNFLNNSFDATSGQSGRWIEVQTHDLGSEIEIWVTDSGKGIPAAVQEKIFQPFFTTKEIGKGTGLGLSISKGIIEGLRGTIRIDNQCPNTRFIVRLPKKQAVKSTLTLASG